MCTATMEELAPKASYKCLPLIPGRMSILDVFRQEFMHAKVVDKCRINNGDFGMLLIGTDGSQNRMMQGVRLGFLRKGS